MKIKEFIKVHTFPFIKEYILEPFNQDRPKGIEQKETLHYSLESDKVFKDLK